MQIESRLTGAATGDSLSNLAGRAVVQGPSAGREDKSTQSPYAGGYDPAMRVSLSAEALLFLSKTRRVPEKQPSLTQEEWSNKLSPQLAAREYQAFGKFGESGDHKAYYRAFIEYYDTLRLEDQNSLRYFGTRDVALAGLRSQEYSDETGTDSEMPFQTLVSVLLDENKADTETAEAEVAVFGVSGDMFGWDTANISYEDVSQVRAEISEIERFYQETF